MRYTRLAACALLALPCLAGEYTWKVDPAGTKVTWTLGSLLHTVHGTFRATQGTLTFDAAAGTASGEIVVDAASGESGSGARDGRMKKSILEVGKYPEIVFSPDRVEGALNTHGESDVKVHGLLKIHGATHEMTIPAKVKMDSRQLNATMKFSIPYVSWGMKNPSTLFLRVDEQVEIEIDAVGALAAR